MKSNNFNETPFLIFVCVAASIVSVTASGIVDHFASGHFASAAPISRWEAAAALFVSPFTETLLFQALPFTILRGRASVSVCLAAMSLPFALAHLALGGTAIFWSPLVGLVLSSVYLFAARRSGRTAVIATSLTHTMHNVLTLVLSIKAGAVLR